MSDTVDLRVTQRVSTPSRATSDGQVGLVDGTRDGALYSADWFLARAMEGRVFGANIGVGTTPATFAGAYDADAPDAYLYVPSGTIVIPQYIMVKWEDIGTESHLEAIALASATGDSSATGTAATIYNMRTDAPVSSLCTCTGAVDAVGVTDPNAGNRVEFWRRGHPIKDTAATGENDRHETVYEWKMGDGVMPLIVGEGSLAVYAASQAGNGFITLIWVEVPSNSIV